MANFTLESKFAAVRDVQRSYNWELEIPNSPLLGTPGDEALLIRCRTAAIPARGNEPIESVFMGMKQFFPGKPTFENTLVVSFEETENQLVTLALYAWQEKVFGIEQGGSNPGMGAMASKREACLDIKLNMYAYNGEVLEKSILFKNSWIQNVAASTLDYTTNESVKREATFQFDYWTLLPEVGA